eukprot:TRINITY_DN18923_c0_g1_i4.p1 TRINITY_DN18923_c0_g1~~TRINITY_DN18923_c0_g1_i4.p1  ORF type:complete len:540 (+),score=120.25 TRINITY_DN18923_c0_g1_i4:53-1621(+)
MRRAAAAVAAAVSCVALTSLVRVLVPSDGSRQAPPVLPPLPLPPPPPTTAPSAEPPVVTPPPGPPEDCAAVSVSDAVWHPAAVLPQVRCSNGDRPGTAAGRKLFYAIAFGGEGDLLRAHLHEVAPACDAVVVVELGVTHRGQAKEAVFPKLQLPQPLRAKVRYFFLSQERVRNMTLHCVVSLPGCRWGKMRPFDLVHFQYRMLSLGMWDAADGDVVVVNGDTDELVHRHTLLRWKHCGAPGTVSSADGQFVPLHFVNLWYNLNCLELPHRVMMRSVWLWRKDYWPQMFQWFGGSSAARAGGRRPLREIGHLLPPEAASRLSDTYTPVHLCRPVCEKAANAGNCKRVMSSKMAGFTPDMQPCSKQRMDEWGPTAHKATAAAIVPADWMSLSNNRDHRRLYQVTTDADGAGDVMSGDAGWHLSYFGGADAIIAHGGKKAHRHKITPVQADKAIRTCAPLWTAGTALPIARVHTARAAAGQVAAGGAVRKERRLVPVRKWADDQLPWFVLQNRRVFECRSWFRQY